MHSTPVARGVVCGGVSGWLSGCGSGAMVAGGVVVVGGERRGVVIGDVGDGEISVSGVLLFLCWGGAGGC